MQHTSLCSFYFGNRMCLWKYYFQTKKTPKIIDTEPVACDEYVPYILILYHFNSQNFRKKCTCLIATTTIIFGTACIVSK